MKKFSTTIVLLLTLTVCNGQVYEFGIIHNTGYNFKVVAIPDFNSTGNTDISDVGFSLVLPAGMDNVINPVGLLTSRTWTVQEFDATFLTGQGLGDDTKDVFQFNLPPGQSLVAHTNGQQIDLVSFDISNTPTSGVMSILLNSDPIATGAAGVLDSFYNSNIDATTTQDYFSGIAVGMDSFSFSTLGVEVPILSKNVTVYPNPTATYINISSTTILDRVELYDVLGKQVLSSNETAQLKVDQLRSGLYFLKLFATTGGIITKKIVIE